LSVTITDLFCGAGGSSLGAELAGGTLRLGLNHWDRAIETHATNFQHADHDCADVSALTTAQIRRYPDSDILLASPECTNHSLAKGARRRKPQAASLFEDGPGGDDEQDRSRATMFDVVRFAEQKIIKGRPYKAIVVENVVDAYRWGANDDGQLFVHWRAMLEGLGYESEIVWLNSMFCPPTPQSRDRMYVVFWQTGMRRPNLRISPPSWCPSCREIVDGIQSFKRVDRPSWGRYGAQYVFRCPSCSGAVLPGVFPAATAIDWQLPAERIGDRARPLAAATRERIRRGLERLLREPFAIRLNHGGVPRPLTLPLVTLTQRHDVGVVLPVAGNTFERTPGNRARRADRQPADTVHGTLDRALVVPVGSENSVAREAETAVSPTVTAGGGSVALVTRTGHKSAARLRGQDARTEPTLAATTQNDLAVVLSNRANNVPRVAGKEPTHPVLTGEHLGVVHLRQHQDVRGIEEPIGTVSAGGGHHGLLGYVVRNNNHRGDPASMVTPAHEPFRTLTTSCHQSLVMVVPYDRTSEPRDAETDPVGTLTTKDRASLVWGDEEIDDCRFRMFALHEIADTMVMRRHTDGGEYVVVGNKRERMAQYGNAVTPPAMEFLVSRLLEVL
jgi:DNA (cytosine-5)-methyltransferase 1